MTREVAIQKIIDELSINNVCLVFNPHIFGEYLEQLYAIGFNAGYLEQIKRGNCKGVSQHSKDGTFIKFFENIRAAERATGINNSDISSVCLGRRQFAGGYVWKHSELNVDNLNTED